MTEAPRTLDYSAPVSQRLITVLLRSIRLRCPNCGRGPVLHHWLKVREACGHCGVTLDRGEADYFMGSLTMNLVLSELIFAAIFIGVILYQWPAPNWTVIQYALPCGVALAPIAMFPVSKLAWFGVDLALRPDSQLG